MSKSEKSKNTKQLVEKELEEFVLESSDFQEFEGVSYENIEKLEEHNIPENQSMVSPLATIENAGAFNNYYYKNGDNFTSQILGGAKNRFIKVTGKVSQNSTGYSKFKGYINTYESNVINSMGYAKNIEQVGKWVSSISTYVQIAAVGGTVLAGPGGWATALSYISRGTLLFKFGAFTSMSYATYARMDYSIAAAKAQTNAFSIMNAKYFPNVSWSFPVIYM